MISRTALLLPLVTGALISQQSVATDRARLHPPNPQNANLKTGPEPGTRIPAFKAVDQNGKAQTLNSLRGPKGLLLAFVRSADW